MMDAGPLLSHCSFDWDQTSLPGLSAVNSFLLPNADDDIYRRASCDSLGTLTTLDDFGFQPSGKPTPALSLDEPRYDQFFPSLSRWSTSTHTDSSIATASPFASGYSVNLEDHPNFAAHSSRSRNKLNLRPWINRLRVLSNRPFTKSGIDLDYMAVMDEDHVESKRDMPRRASHTLRHAKSLPDMSDPDAYKQRPLPPVPDMTQSEAFRRASSRGSQPRASFTPRKYEERDSLQNLDDGGVFQRFSQDTFSRPPSAEMYPDLPSLECNNGPAPTQPQHRLTPLLDRRVHSFARSSVDDADGAWTKARSSPRGSNSNSSCWPPSPPPDRADSPNVQRESGELANYTFTPVDTFNAPNPVDTFDLPTPVDAFATPTPTAHPAPSADYHTALEQRVLELEARLATYEREREQRLANEREWERRLGNLEKGQRLGCVQRLQEPRMRAGALPPTPTSPRFADTLAAPRAPPPPPPTDAPQAALRSSRSLCSINEAEAAVPRKLSRQPESLMFAIWPKPPSGRPSRASSRQSSRRPSTAESLSVTVPSTNSSKRASDASSVPPPPPVPGAFPRSGTSSARATAQPSSAPSRRGSLHRVDDV